MKIKVSYVLINTIPEYEHVVYNRLSNIQSIIELKPLYREYDMIAKIESKNKDSLAELVTEEIRSHDGVIDTKVIQ